MRKLTSIYCAILFGVVVIGCDVSAERSEAVVNESRAAEIVNESESMESKLESKKHTRFQDVLENTLTKRAIKREEFCDADDYVQKRVLNEYGAMFLAADGVTPPPVCMFRNEEQVKKYQSGLSIASENFDEAKIELQTNAMKSLLEAKSKIEEKGLTLTPRDGTEAARRGFEDTVRLWNSRFEPACEHWLAKNRLKKEEVHRLRSLAINDQVREVLKLEERGIFFNTFFNNSILYSVAAPGTSQHLSMLAFDAEEFANEKVRKILGEHGWFRTVKNDAPHFTFLGLKKDELKQNGLKKIETGDGEFWIPNI